MGFEEEFPSLKGEGTNDMETDCMTELIFHSDIIEEYCLDKQRVKEVISKYGTHEGSDEVTHPTILKILEELGLK